MIAMSCAVVGTAEAQEEKAYSFNQRDLAAALRAFISESGRDLIFSHDLVEGRKANTVSGTFSDEEALRRLLSGTGLRFEVTRSGALSLHTEAKVIKSSAARAGEFLVAQAGSSLLPAAAPPPTLAEGDEILVTGTRIVRDGFEAPTPVSVIGIAEIQAAAPANIADFVNQMPSLAAGLSPTAYSGVGVSTAREGLNNLNLRGLGIGRTLVLLNGHRFISGETSGAVNINDIPQPLVSRVDVVTGGASAAYGSDAVSGVVNFVIDDKFTGVKGEIQGGITTYGDNPNYKVMLTVGQPFAGGRGHFLISGEYNYIRGIAGFPRDWNAIQQRRMNNPAYGTGAGQSTSVPQYLNLPHVGIANASPGGLITAGPLKGIDFGPGGTTRMYNYGSLVSYPFMQGGDYQYSDDSDTANLMPPHRRQNLFARVSYDVSDALTLWSNYIYSYNRGHTQGFSQFRLGNNTIRVDNAFMPEDVRSRMVVLGLTTITMGTLNADMPLVTQDNERLMHSYALGADGSFDVFGNSWSWSLYGAHGSSPININAHVIHLDRYAAALDAVRSPTTGAIVCRSTLANPGNGCVPYNTFGIGVNSQAAIDYVLGTTMRQQRTSQNVMEFAASGDIFDLPAGAVSIALGGSYRKESVAGVVDPDSLRLQTGNAAWNTGNYQPTNGSYNVKEAFVETVVPIVRGAAWASSLEINGAVRATDYSTAGYVTTWKIGANYAPIDDLRFRITRSRDIRAPNLDDLFASGSGSVNTNLVDTVTGRIAQQYLRSQSGNPLLKPEVGDQLGVGAVYQPSWLPGLSLSADVYDIKIAGSVSVTGVEDTVNRCARGESFFCNNIIRNAAGDITIVRTQPFNALRQRTNGIDLEASYRTSLDTFFDDWSGDIALRIMATNVWELTTDNGVLEPTDAAGRNASLGAGPPDWRYMTSMTYDNGPFTGVLTLRGISDGTVNNAYIECQTGCPVSTAEHRTINNNYMPGAYWLDANITYHIRTVEEDGHDIDMYLAVQNVLDRDPPPDGDRNLTFYPSGNGMLYDLLGRTFRAGLRFRM